MNYNFNGNQLPKFWFGDRVVHLQRKGKICGMQWKDDTSHPGNLETCFGWIYAIHFDRGFGAQWVHEDSLNKEES